MSGAFLCSLRNSISRKHFIVFLTAVLLKCFCRKNLSPQLVAVLCSWRCCSSLEVRLGHVTSDRCISVDREVPQGAPESPLVFVMVADEILGGLRPSQERRNFASTCDEVSLSCLGYADDVLLFSGSKASLEAVMEECCVKFGEAGLEVGLDKSHWSSSTAMDGETLAVRGQSREWERKLEFLGSVIEPGAHIGGAVRHRTQKASSVFCKWQPLLCNPNVPLKERVKAFGAITLSSATWLSGCWTLSKQQEQASESWCARLLSQMVGFKRDPHDDFALSGRKLHRRGHELAEVFAGSPVDLYLRAKHRLAIILPVLRTTTQCTWCWCVVELTRRGSTRGAGNRVWSGRTGVRVWSVVETQGPWVGLRLQLANK